MSKIRRVLIAVDDSVQSARAVKKGVKMAIQLDADVILVSVVDQADSIGDIDSGVLPEESKVILEKEERGVLNNYMRLFPDLNIATVILQGDPENAIVKYAEEMKVDLIVIGGHQKSFMEGLFTVNIRKYIFEHTRIPLLVVRE
ncbi:universal stress protein [Halosquirtibacter xylanolyticus]|uniref:universal stress protein n=1 Tax=Halosquirtibacter xylanolyticus TaxID=3374599 RepID=UPI003749A72C|nr:universal stress protein [Prolixibacteraceae bacterium]